MKSALQLRCLIRAGEARLDFMADMLRDAKPGDLLPGDWPRECEQLTFRLTAYQAELAKLSTAAHPSASRAPIQSGDSSAPAEQAAQPSTIS